MSILEPPPRTSDAAARCGISRVNSCLYNARQRSETIDHSRRHRVREEDDVSFSQSFGSQGFRERQKQQSCDGHTAANHADQGPPKSGKRAPRRRMLRSEDALLHLDQVKQQFGIELETYAHFMDITRDFLVAYDNGPEAQLQ